MIRKILKPVVVLISAAMVFGSISAPAFAEEGVPAEEAEAFVMEETETAAAVEEAADPYFAEAEQDAEIAAEAVSPLDPQSEAQEPEAEEQEPASEAEETPEVPEAVSADETAVVPEAADIAAADASEDVMEEAEAEPASIAEETTEALEEGVSLELQEVQESSEVQEETAEEANEEETTEAEEDAELELQEVVTKLDTPKLNSVENKAEGTVISWSAVKNAETYAVYRKVRGSSWSRIATTTSLSFADTTNVRGVGYYYTVKAFHGSVKSGYNKTGLYIINPGIVQMKDCSIVAGGIKVQWNAIPGATGYQLYRKTGLDGKWSKIKTLTATSYTDPAGQSGKTYYYTVRAYITSNSTTYRGWYQTPGAMCAYVSIPKLTGTNNTASGIQVKWNAVAGAASYRVYRKTAGGSWNYLADVAENSFTDTTVKTNTAYYYTVRAYTATGRGYYDKKGIYGYIGSKVKLVSCTLQGTGLQIQWQAVSGASGYYVYRSTTPGANWSRIATVKSGTTYLDTKAPSGTKVYYTVRAYQTISGTKYRSMYDTAGVSGMFLKAPTLGTVTGDKNAPSFTITWQAVGGAASYIVLRKTGSGSWETIATVKTTSYKDTKINKTSDYYYTVRAVSASNIKSSYDKSGLFATFNPGPVLVSAVSNPSGVQVTWNAFSGAEGYYVYRKVGSDAKWKRIGSTTKTTWLDYNANAGKSNFYTVRAYYHSGGELKLSNYNSAGISCYFSDAVRVKAANKLAVLNNSLKAAYDWAKNLKYVDRPSGHTATWYANIPFQYNNGDCFSKASVFCWMARELGYTAFVMDGQVPRARGGYADHGWVEITVNGKTYVCDPEFEYENPTRNGYMITYGQSGTWVYMNWKQMADY